MGHKTLLLHVSKWDVTYLKGLSRSTKITKEGGKRVVHITPLLHKPYL